LRCRPRTHPCARRPIRHPSNTTRACIMSICRQPTLGSCARPCRRSARDTDSCG
jgi:hypothetical protein